MDRMTKARVSQRRANIEMDVEKNLTNYMIAQQRDGVGYVTVYRGSRSEFVGAGIPPVVMDQPSNRTAFEFKANDRDAELSRKGDTFELTLHWDEDGPWYDNAAHPALAEIARMIHIDGCYWLNGLPSQHDHRHPIVNTDGLLDCGRATDYKLPKSMKFRFDPECHRLLHHHLHGLWHAIQMAEIRLVEPPVLPKPPRKARTTPAARAKLVEAARSNEQVQSLIASALSKASKRKSKSSGAP